MISDSGLLFGGHPV